MGLVLTPEEEAVVIMYIVNYYDCDDKCWDDLAAIIRKYGQRRTGIVYRGMGSPRILKKRPFLSTTPLRKMAELFMPVDWDAPGGPKKLCCLHKIHLVNAPVLSTRSIKYSLSKEVERLYKAYKPEKPWSRVGPLIDELVFADEKQNGEEVIVLNDGVFYKDKGLTSPGFFRHSETHLESWYSAGKRARKQTRRKQK